MPIGQTNANLAELAAGLNGFLLGGAADGRLVFSFESSGQVGPMMENGLTNTFYSLHVNLKYLLASICPPLSKQITALGFSGVTVKVSSSLPSVS